MGGKRTAIIAVVLALIVCLGGCFGFLPKKAENTPQPSPSASETETIVSAAPASEPTEQPGNTPEIPVSEIPFDVSGITIGEGGTFYLGQSFDDVIEKLGELGIDDYSQIEITNEPEAWNWGDTVIGSVVAAFSIRETVYTIRVDWLSGIPTAEGLKAGDTLDKMKELYGTEYTAYAYGDSGAVYEYTTGNHYFQVFAGNEDNLVQEWAISLYKYDK